MGRPCANVHSGWMLWRGLEVVVVVVVDVAGNGVHGPSTPKKYEGTEGKGLHSPCPVCIIQGFSKHTESEFLPEHGRNKQGVQSVKR